MSYILDALRKSERQRRLGQPPDLDAAPSSDHSKVAPGRPALRWTLGAVLTLILATVGGWYWLGKPDRPAATEQPQVAEQPQPAPSDPPSTAAEPAPEEAAAAPDEAAQAPEVGQRRTRTVVDRRSPSQRPVTSVSRPAPARPGAVATPPPAIPDGERERLVTDAEQARRLIQAQAAAAQREPQPPTERSAAEDAANPDSTGAQDPDWAPDRAEFVQVWELPLAIRRELPELDLSIHVFSAEPTERFVLINGERRREGESLGDGARLAEINRRGAVVDFRDYRFLLQP